MNLLSKIIFTFLVLAVFFTGFAVGGFTSLSLDNVQTYTVTNKGIKFQAVETTPKPQTVLSSKKSEIDFENPVEKISPHNWINEKDIEMRNDGFCVKNNNYEWSWAIIADTNSMDPVIDENSHVIQIIPNSINDIHVGDIISYESEYGFIIIHRVIGKGSDNQGSYVVTQGDNNTHPDPYKIRFRDIKKITVATIN